jgi:phosphohistidine phosphatase
MNFKGNKVTFILQRHGDAQKKAAGQNDIERSLNDDGRSQAKALGAKLNRRIDLVISSSAIRTKETAEITAKSAMVTETVLVHPVDSMFAHEHLYPVTTKAFAVLGYSPLSSYMLIPEVAQELEYYGKNAVKKIGELFSDLIADKSDQEFVILVTTHAVCANAIARALQLLDNGKAFNPKMQDLVLVGDTPVDPAAAFVLELNEDGTTAVEYIKP